MKNEIYSSKEELLMSQMQNVTKQRPNLVIHQNIHRHWLTFVAEFTVRPWGYCIMGYLKLKSCEISFVHNINVSIQIVLPIYTEHGSDTWQW